MPNHPDSDPCGCDRDREPVIHSVDPVIGPVGGGDATHLTTIRGEHLAGVRRVKFGGAKVRSRDFVTQTDTTIVLEAPISLATVPTGVAPDFPLGVAVTARTRRHKSKPLTYTYSASSGGERVIYLISGSTCSEIDTVTLAFTDPVTGTPRSPTVTYQTPIPRGTAGIFNNGPRGGNETVISVSFRDNEGEITQQCFVPFLVHTIGFIDLFMRDSLGSGCGVDLEFSRGIQEIFPCPTTVKL